MRLSKNVQRMESSVTMAISAKAAAMRRQGIDVISLSAGEPDFDTPQHIKDAAIRAIQEGFTKYTIPGSGIIELKEAICRKIKRDSGLDYSLDQVIVNNGAKHTLFLASAALLDPGDEVIIPTPYWVTFSEQPKLMGGDPVVVQTRAENHLKMTAGEFEAAITPRTRMLILNSPSNPSGMVYTRAELEAIARVAVKHQILVLSDEIYEQLVYGGAQHCSISTLGEEIRKLAIVVNGVSKTYSMTGWRIGYAAGPVELIKAIGAVQSHSTSNPSSISQAASVEALNGPQDFIPKNNAVFKQRRDLVVDMLNKAKGIHCHKPEGAFYVYPSCAGTIGRRTPQGKSIQTDEDFASYLLESEGVAVVHGAAFGLSPYFRISYATSTEALKDACTRIQRACAALS